MAKLTISVKDIDAYKKVLQLLNDIIHDPRIDEGVRHGYVKALQDITEQSQAERK